MGHPGPDLAVDAMRSTIDRVAGIFAAPPWEQEIGRARQQYDELRGRIFDDDELYAIHMASFLEWYTIERPLAGGEPPMMAALRQELIVAEERRACRALASSYRSLFEVRQQLPDALLLDDLIGGGRWRVECTPRAGMDPGELFEGRLVPWTGRVLFGPAMLFHPRAAYRAIHAMLQAWAAARRLSPERIEALAEMRMRFSRFRNIAVDHIYKERQDRSNGGRDAGSDNDAAAGSVD